MKPSAYDYVLDQQREVRVLLQQLLAPVPNEHLVLLTASEDSIWLNG